MTNGEALFEELKKLRKNDFLFHFKLGLDWLNFGVRDKLQSPLVYSAFEFRLAIERFTFELFYLIKKNEGITTKDENKTVNFNSFFLNVYDLAGGKEMFYKKLRFNAIVATFAKPRITIAEPDLEKIKKLWNKLSKFCHMQLKPQESWYMNEEFINEGYSLLSEVKDYFNKNIYDARIGWFTENVTSEDMFIQLRDEFLSGKIDEETFKGRYTTMSPMFDLAEKIKRSIIE